MDINEKYKSPLKMIGLEITDVAFKHHLKDTEVSLNLDINKKIDTLKDNTFLVTIYTNIHDKNNELNLDVTCSAKFSISEDVPKDVVENLINKSAVAIMFPYIRSYVSTVTTAPNMQPIVLPPININKFFEDKENEIQ